MRFMMVSFCLGMIATAWMGSLVGKNLSIVCVSLPLWLYIIQSLLQCFRGFIFQCLFTGGISLCFFLSGVGVANWFAHTHAEEVLPDSLQGKVVQVKGVVTGLPKHVDGLWQFMLEDVSISGQPLKGRLRLSWFSYRSLKPGQLWLLAVRLKSPHGIVSPGAFDVESWLRREHVTGTGYVSRDKRNRCISKNAWRVDVWRDYLIHYIEAKLPGVKTGLAQALLMGNKGGVSQEDWRLFNRTGTTHLLVISGLHIGLMFILGCTLLRGLRYLSILPIHRVAFPRLAVIVGLCFSVVYALLAGFSVPVQRALIMLVCGCFGKFLDFIPKPSTVWLVAMVGVLLLEPMAVTSSGFWYSFIAVASLLLVFSNRTGSFPRWKRWWLPQWSVFVALLPLLLFYGQPSTLWSPLINLVSIPLVGLIIVPALMVGLFIALLPGQLIWPLKGSVALLNYWHDSLQWVSSFIETSSGQGIPSGFILGFCLVGVLYLLLPKGLGWRWFALPCLLLIWHPPKKNLSQGEAEITLLDDRRVQIALIRTRRHILIYDMGDKTKNDRFNTTQSTLLPFLRKHHIESVDAWVLPRSSSEEKAGQQFQERVPIHKTYSAHPAFEQLACHQGASWYWDGVKFTVLPEKQTCVLQVDSKTQKALFTGTLSAHRARYWVKSNPKTLKADVWVTSVPQAYLQKSFSIIDTVSPSYIALSQTSPHKAKLQMRKMGDTPPYCLAATAYTGTQSYLLGRYPEVKADFSRNTERRWWRYDKVE